MLSCMVVSCKKKEATKWNVDIAAPVVNSHLSLNNIVTEDFISTDTNGKVTLVFQQDLVSDQLGTILNFPDTTLVKEYALPQGVSSDFYPGSSFAPANQTKNKFKIGDAEITYLEIESGTMKYSVSSGLEGITFYNFYFPNAIDASGQTLQETLKVPKGTPAQPASNSSEVDLAGYRIDLSDGGITSNTINIQGGVTFDPDGDTVFANYKNKVTAKAEFVDVKIKYAKGFFGKQKLDSRDSVRLSTFNRICKGALDLEEVEMSLEIQNGVGVEATLQLNELISVDSSKSSTIALESNLIGSSILINRATQVNGQITPALHTIKLNTENSNIDKLIENFPDQFKSSLELQLNPLSDQVVFNDFIDSHSPFKTNLKVEIPLNLIASSLTLCDTLSFNFKELDRINRLKLNCLIDNGFPLNGNLKLRVLRSDGSAGPELASQGQILSAQIDASNEVTSNNLSLLEIIVPEAEIAFLQKSQKIIIETELSTKDQVNFTSIYTHYAIGVKISLDLNYGMEVK